MNKFCLYLIKTTTNSKKEYMFIRLPYGWVPYDDNVIGNVITKIVSDLFKNIYGNDVDVEVYERIDKFDFRDDNFYILTEALCHLIYFDDICNRWVITNYNEPNFNLINYTKEDMRLNVILVGDGHIYSNSKKDIEDLKNKFFKLYHISDIVISYYNLKNKDGSINITHFDDVFMRGRGYKNQYVLLLSDGMCIKELENVEMVCSRYKNIETYTYTKNNFYILVSEVGGITMKKVMLR